ncbi:MAG: DUF11 domain-containing protein, partial [Aeriscardovia sp.]|nr:DUF11 domain-containing protein [Aeriscardovia sp.]
MKIRHYILKMFLCVGGLFSSVQGVYAVQANINSGNPAFPFPQFMDYGADRKSLASHNAPGVTHAEMEQRCRDAWQHICNNTKEQGYEVGGVQYLVPNTDEVEEHCSCAEGDGYYLLGSAIMADKVFFDGYYMSMHDRTFLAVKRFVDGGENSYDGYSKGLNHSGSLGSNAGFNFDGPGVNDGSATDGDVDIAMALIIAYKQWGEHSGVMTPYGELNYKEEALKYVRAMVDTVRYAMSLPEKTYVSGDVGFDGYLKGGSHQTQLTTWATNGSGYQYHGIPSEYGGSQMLYFDYLAPAYFNEYRKLLESDSESTDWQINQCLRCEASSDWLMGKLYERSETTIPVCGTVTMGATDQNFIFGNSQFSEDFRAGWRTILNYVWHGTPEYTWDPVEHEAVAGSNDYEKRMGLRYGKFLANPQGAPWGNACNAVGDMGLNFFGPYTLRSEMNLDGEIGKGFPLNWIHGTGAPAAVVSQDFVLMGQMFRHCVMVWDDEDNEYKEASPHYFHEWFKLLGMLVLSGNMHAPSNMVAKPNLKVYHKVNKTYAFAGDEVEFTVSVRNYGSVDAAGTVVKFGLPEGFSLVKSTKGTLVGDSVVWNLGVLPGFTSTTGLKPTIDSMVITCRLNDDIEQGRYCTSARIFCDNGLG